METKNKHLFILNPKSFWHKWKQEQAIAKIHKFFTTIGNNNYEIYISRFPRDAIGFIARFAKELPDDCHLRVYAVGGDGILFDCLNGIMGLKNAELAVLPYGRTNNFIQGFGKNSKPLFRDIQQQYNSSSIPLDVIRCGNTYALSYCVIGVEAEAIRYADKIRRKMVKGNLFSQWLCRVSYKIHYFIGALIACLDINLFRQKYELEISGDKTFGSFCGIASFNCSYYGGTLHPLSKAMPNDGLLDVLIIKGNGPLRTFSLFPFYVYGQYHLFKKNFIFKQGSKIKVHSDSSIIYSMDDFVFFDRELEIELLPGALRFIDAGKQGYIGASNEK
ncbi:MAG: hypothetical protein FWH41_01320 [Treponema sp.]|nr:hypothetical protein [Treponema sp.]